MISTNINLSLCKIKAKTKTLTTGLKIHKSINLSIGLSKIYWPPARLRPVGEYWTTPRRVEPAPRRESLCFLRPFYVKNDRGDSKWKKK